MSDVPSRAFGGTDKQGDVRIRGRRNEIPSRVDVEEAAAKVKEDPEQSSGWGTLGSFKQNGREVKERKEPEKHERLERDAKRAEATERAPRDRIARI
jgi:hypothetical protein